MTDMTQENILATEQQTNTDTELPVESVGFKDWRTSLADDLKEHPSLQTIPDINTLAKNYVNTKALVGKKVSEMSAEEAFLFNQNNNLPNSIDEYQVNLSEPVNEDRLNFMRKLAFDNKVPKDKFGKIMEEVIDYEKQQLALMEDDARRVRELWRSQIRTDFGEDLDEAKKNIINLLDRFGSDALKKELLNPRNNIIDNPIAFEFLANIGKEFKQGSYVGNSAGSLNVMLPAEALKKLEIINSDPDNIAILSDRLHPQHKSLTEERMRLYRIAFPDRV